MSDPKKYSPLMCDYDPPVHDNDDDLSTFRIIHLCLKIDVEIFREGKTQLTVLFCMKRLGIKHKGQFRYFFKTS